MDDKLQPNRDATAERCTLEGSVLLVQDTTTPDYSELLGCTPGLGPLGGTWRGKDGMLVDAGPALWEGGVFWLLPWARHAAGPQVAYSSQIATTPNVRQSFSLNRFHQPFRHSLSHAKDSSQNKLVILWC